MIVRVGTICFLVFFKWFGCESALAQERYLRDTTLRLTASSIHLSKNVPGFSQWLRLGIGSTFFYNFTSIASDITIPSSGNAEFVPVSSMALHLRAQRDFSARWAGTLGIGYSNFGMGIRTQYPNGGTGQVTFFAQQLQLLSFLQYYLIEKEAVRPYLELGIITNINPTKRASDATFRFSRQYGDQPTYLDEISIKLDRWIRPGLVVGLGMSCQNKAGWSIKVAGVYYRGFSNLTAFKYEVKENNRIDPPSTVLKTTLVNRSSFVGIDFSIYLPPFGYKKLMKRRIGW